MYGFLIVGYQISLAGRFDSHDLAKNAAESHSRKHGVETVVIELLESCKPLPREVEWSEVK